MALLNWYQLLTLTDLRPKLVEWDLVPAGCATAILGLGALQPNQMSNFIFVVFR